jgi:hypothetical protein
MRSIIHQQDFQYSVVEHGGRAKMQATKRFLISGQKGSENRIKFI